MSDIQIPKDVLDAILSELAYQQGRADDWDHANKPSFEAELVVLRHLLGESDDAWYFNKNNDQALHSIRKLVATGIRCMINHGAVPRPKIDS